MARYTGPVCKLCRREGMKLFLKGSRCESPKCAVTRREVVPGGQKGKRTRGRPSEWSKRFRETIKVKRFYGILERQFRRYMDEATRTKGSTGEALLRLLETRLDNTVLRLGFAVSRFQARQLIRHGHILVNGHKTNIPSYAVVSGDSIKPAAKEGAGRLVKWGMEESKGKQVPPWLERLEGEAPEGKVLRHPAREEISAEVNEQLIVEFCSR